MHSPDSPDPQNGSPAPEHLPDHGDIEEAALAFEAFDHFIGETRGMESDSEARVAAGITRIAPELHDLAVAGDEDAVRAKFDAYLTDEDETVRAAAGDLLRNSQLSELRRDIESKSITAVSRLGENNQIAAEGLTASQRLISRDTADFRKISEATLTALRRRSLDQAVAIHRDAQAYGEGLPGVNIHKQRLNAWGNSQTEVGRQLRADYDIEITRERAINEHADDATLQPDMLTDTAKRENARQLTDLLQNLPIDQSAEEAVATYLEQSYPQIRHSKARVDFVDNYVRFTVQHTGALERQSTDSNLAAQDYVRTGNTVTRSKQPSDEIVRDLERKSNMALSLADEVRKKSPALFADAELQLQRFNRLMETANNPQE